MPAARMPSDGAVGGLAGARDPVELAELRGVLGLDRRESGRVRTSAEAQAPAGELGMFLWLATTLGARRGELTGLRWSDVDLKRAVLRIEMSYVVRKSQRQL